MSRVCTRFLLRLTAVVAVIIPVAAAAGLVRRVEVEGDSMLPSLESGDRVVVIRVLVGSRIRVGTTVVARDPRSLERLVVKRVGGVGPAGIELVGDNPAASTDSRSFGPVPEVWGRVVYRYGPAGRAQRVSRMPAPPIDQ